VSLGQAGQGSGKINVATVGNMLNAAEDAEIWDALTEGQGTYEEATRPRRSTARSSTRTISWPPDAGTVFACETGAAGPRSFPGQARSAARGEPVLEVAAQRLGHAGARQDHPAPPRLDLHALDDLTRFRPCSAV
jgi:hypothetical protein